MSASRESARHAARALSAPPAARMQLAVPSISSATTAATLMAGPAPASYVAEMEIHAARVLRGARTAINASRNPTALFLRAALSVFRAGRKDFVRHLPSAIMTRMAIRSATNAAKKDLPAANMIGALKAPSAITVARDCPNVSHVALTASAAATIRNKRNSHAPLASSARRE
mmetsp:Transcript_8072/g.17445  ORF Transcript_8072/g.17445 Transcript_8072/m.17445 type:complete len:172 (-) Transcript_8072:382-897(-)